MGNISSYICILILATSIIITNLTIGNLQKEIKEIKHQYVLVVERLNKLEHPELITKYRKEKDERTKR